MVPGHQMLTAEQPLEKKFEDAAPFPYIGSKLQGAYPRVYNLVHGHIDARQDDPIDPPPAVKERELLLARSLRRPGGQVSYQAIDFVEGEGGEGLA